MISQPIVSINGKDLKPAQALLMVMAVERLYEDLMSPEYLESLGPIGGFYKEQVRELMGIIVSESIKEPGELEKSSAT